MRRRPTKKLPRPSPRKKAVSTVDSAIWLAPTTSAAFADPDDLVAQTERAREEEKHGRERERRGAGAGHGVLK
jgi:hypothetical protein